MFALCGRVAVRPMHTGPQHEQGLCLSLRFLSTAFEKLFSENPHGSAMAKTLDEFGFTQPTAVQKSTIPHLVAGRNAVMCAQTGTGKTIAYLAPILCRLRTMIDSDSTKADKNEENGNAEEMPPMKGVSLLVILPTTLLANQVHKQIEQILKSTQWKDVRVMCITSGPNINTQVKQLQQQNPHIAVCTPGRLIELLSKDKPAPNGAKCEENRYHSVVHLGDMRFFVVDEVEKLLGMNFSENVREIWKHMPRKHATQTVFVSATIVDNIRELMTRIAPKHLELNSNPKSKPAQSITHIAYSVSQRKKIALLSYLLRRRGSLRNKHVIVFVRTKHRADSLAERLVEEGIPCKAVHKDVSFAKKQAAIESGPKVLVATDVLSRGIDISSVEVVVNFDMPDTTVDYTHRVGRTARGDHSGTAINLVDSAEDEEFMRGVEKQTRTKVEFRKVPGPWNDEDAISVAKKDVPTQLPVDREAQLQQVAQNLKKFQKEKKLQLRYGERERVVLERFKSNQDKKTKKVHTVHSDNKKAGTKKQKQ